MMTGRPIIPVDTGYPPDRQKTILRECGAMAVILPEGMEWPADIQDSPPLFDIVFTNEAIRDYRSTLTGDVDLMRRFNALLRERGILKGESKYYVSLAHTPEDVRFTIEAWESAIKVLKN